MYLLRYFAILSVLHFYLGFSFVFPCNRLSRTFSLGDTINGDDKMRWEEYMNSLSGFPTSDADVSRLSSSSFEAEIEDHALDRGQDENKKIKALCLHGYLSSSRHFQVQLRRLIGLSANFVEYVFLDAPNELSLPRATGLQTDDKRKGEENKTKSSKFRWWHSIKFSDSLGTASQSDSDTDTIYDGLDNSLRLIAKTQEERGPYDILIGYSQGAGLVLAIDFLKTRLDLIELILMRESEKGEKPFCAEKIEEEARFIQDNLNKFTYSVLMSAFLPRDRIFNLPSIDREASLSHGQHYVGLKTKSLHVFSQSDEIIAPEASIDAMSAYHMPTLKVTSEERHEPPQSEADLYMIVETLRGVWRSKFTKPLILDD